MTDTTEVQPEPEVPQEPAAAPAENPAPEVPETPQEGAQAGSDGEEETTPDSSSGSTTTSTENSAETSTSSAEPEVVNDVNGQHVNMPDGTTVTTRTHPYPVTNSEWETYELTHSGDQLRYPYKPGDAGYNANSDPSVPNSWLAKQIEVQLASFGERVKTDPNARPSVTWDALQPGYQGDLAEAIQTGGGGGKVEA